MDRNRKSLVDVEGPPPVLKELARIYCWAFVTTIACTLYYAIVIVFVEILGVHSGPGWQIATALVCFFVLKFSAVGRLVQLSEGLKDPILLSIMLFLLSLPLLVDPLLLVIWLVRTRRFLRKSGIDVSSWWISPSALSWRNDGNCAYCGYNLTGNVSGVCPECENAIRALSGGTSA